MLTGAPVRFMSKPKRGSARAPRGLPIPALPEEQGLGRGGLAMARAASAMVHVECAKVPVKKASGPAVLRRTRIEGGRPRSEVRVDECCCARARSLWRQENLALVVHLSAADVRSSEALSAMRPWPACRESRCAGWRVERASQSRDPRPSSAGFSHVV